MGGTMKNVGVLIALAMIGSIVFVSAETCMGGGFDNGIIGPRGSSMGTAFAGLADDPTAIFYNPAGVALLERDRGLSLTVRYSTTDLKFNYTDDRTTPSGKTGGKSTLVGVILTLVVATELCPPSLSVACTATVGPPVSV